MERMKEIEIFGIPALFTEKRIDHDAVYPGMYRYELETVNNGPKRVSDTASGTFLGTVLTPVPIPMDNGQRELAPDDSAWYSSLSHERERIGGRFPFASYFSPFGDRYFSSNSSHTCSYPNGQRAA